MPATLIPRPNYSAPIHEILHVLDPLHHSLNSTLRMIYTHAAWRRVTGTTMKSTDELLRQDLYIANEAVHGMNGSFNVSDKATANTRTALKRLGVDTQEDITRYIVCPKCWNLVPLTNLATLEGPNCRETVTGPRGAVETCNELLYRQNNNTRTPIKVIPYYRLSTVIKKLLQDSEVSRIYRIGDNLLMIEFRKTTLSFQYLRLSPIVDMMG